MEGHRPSGPASVSQLLRQKLQGRTRFLLISLFALILLYPMVQHTRLGVHFLLALNTATLVTATYAVADRRRHIVTAAAIAVPQFLLGLAVLFLPPGSGVLRPAVLAESALIVVFYAYAIVRVLDFILRSPNVSTDTIYGGVAVYLMLGLGWAAIYAILEMLIPGSFELELGSQQTNVFGSLRLVYFSFVTMTTLGYGDIVPLTDRARSLAIFQTITGQLYLAVMIARLVSLYQPHKEEKAV